MMHDIPSRFKNARSCNMLVSPYQENPETACQLIAHVAATSVYDANSQ